MVNDSLITKQEDVLAAWVSHFAKLGASRASETVRLQQLHESLSTLYADSFNNDDVILDVPFCVDEIEGAIKKLKAGKSAGPDGILSEHLLHGGYKLRLWLTNIFNAIINLDSVPECFTEAIIVPLYKGNGKNPLLTNSYRGISLTSIVSKLFERILLNRCLPVLQDANIPHCTQTAYQVGISCSDPTEVVQEAIRSLIQHGGSAFQLFYDLEKAFDSVEYCIRLDHLYKAGISGKSWRIRKTFYNRPTCKVRLEGRLSMSFPLERGVRQGCVLSPILFLVVINSLLTKLAQENQGVSIGSISPGSFGHADDLRSVTTNLVSIQRQAEIVHKFTINNFLTLNLDKLELLPMSSGLSPEECSVTIGSHTVSSSTSVKCLGVIWSSNLSPKAAIEHNIHKARRAFFATGALGTTKGKLNPLSSSEIVAACVLPVCLYGCENWLLTDPLLQLLENFQAEIGKRILKLPKWQANISVLVALGWSTMRCRILCRKLGFLQRLSSPHKQTISASVFAHLREQEPGPLIIQQCNFLEQVYNTNLTSTLLEGSESLRVIKKSLINADKLYIQSLVSEHRSLSLLSDSISWPKLWDTARDFGTQGVRSIREVFKLLTRPTFGDRSCPYGTHAIPEDSLFAEHVVSYHLDYSLDTILECNDEDLFKFAVELKQLSAGLDQ